MANGDRPRHGGGGSRGARPGGTRRTPPPEATGKEAAELQRIKDARETVVVRTTTGQTLQGVVEYLDRDKIKLTRPDGPNLFLRKTDIRYITGPAEPEP